MSRANAQCPSDCGGSWLWDGTNSTLLLCRPRLPEKSSVGRSSSPSSLASPGGVGRRQTFRDSLPNDVIDNTLPPLHLGQQQRHDNPTVMLASCQWCAQPSCRGFITKVSISRKALSVTRFVSSTYIEAPNTTDIVSLFSCYGHALASVRLHHSHRVAAAVGHIHHSPWTSFSPSP